MCGCDRKLDMEALTARPHVTRCVCEILLSGTLASALITGVVNSNEIYWNSQFFGLQAGFNHTFHGINSAHLGVNLAFYLILFALTIVGFILLRAFSRFAVTATLLRTIVGPVAVAAPPVFLWPAARYRSDPLWAGVWEPLEACVAAAGALLSAAGQWPFSVRAAAILVALHGALWLRAYAAQFYFFALCWQTLPVVACLATLAWMLAWPRRRGSLRSERRTG